MVSVDLGSTERQSYGSCIPGVDRCSTAVWPILYIDRMMIATGEKRKTTNSSVNKASCQALRHRTVLLVVTGHHRRGRCLNENISGIGTPSILRPVIFQVPEI